MRRSHEEQVDAARSPADGRVVTDPHDADRTVSDHTDRTDRIGHTDHDHTHRLDRVDHQDPAAPTERLDRAEPTVREQPVVDHRTVLAREKERYGGVKLGSAFFGWLTATGMAVLLTALLAGGGAAVDLGGLADVDQAVQDAGRNAETIGIAGGVALLVILFVAYFCGGYVAGRMARFDGIRQGLAVWVWSLLIAVVVAVVAAVAGDEYDILARVDSFPRLPVNEGDLTTAGVVTAVAVVVASLVGAMLGGVAGMRFHRRVDRAGLAPDPQPSA
jgi:hypothetical protein